MFQHGMWRKKRRRPLEETYALSSPQTFSLIYLVARGTWPGKRPTQNATREAVRRRDLEHVVYINQGVIAHAKHASSAANCLPRFSRKNGRSRGNAASWSFVCTRQVDNTRCIVAVSTDRMYALPWTATRGSRYQRETYLRCGPVSRFAAASCLPLP